MIVAHRKLALRCMPLETRLVIVHLRLTCSSASAKNNAAEIFELSKRSTKQLAKARRLSQKLRYAPLNRNPRLENVGFEGAILSRGLGPCGARV